MAPEWLPERSHDPGRQSNAAIDIGLKVARVGDDGTQVGELVNKFDYQVLHMLRETGNYEYHHRSIESFRSNRSYSVLSHCAKE